MSIDMKQIKFNRLFKNNIIDNNNKTIKYKIENKIFELKIKEIKK